MGDYILDDCLTVAFSCDKDDENACALTVAKKGSDDAIYILNTFTGQNARTLYEILTDTFPGRSR